MKLLVNKSQLENENFWLLAIAGGLIALHQHFIYRQSGAISIEALVFWFAALTIAWRRRYTLDLESNFLSSGIGITLIAWALLRSILWKGYLDNLNQITPFVSTLGLCLIASDARKVRQYWRELAIVGLSAFPFKYIFFLLSIPEATTVIDAKFSSYVLWYAGFSVFQQGNRVILPTGIIQVEEACSSFILIWLLLQLSLVFCLTFSVRSRQKVLLLLAAIFIGFVVNGLRLCVMALVVANNNQAAFEYWHGSSGAEMFTSIAFLLLGLFYIVITRDSPKKRLVSDHERNRTKT